MHRAFVGWFLGVALILVLSVFAAGRLVDPFGHFSNTWTSYPDFMTPDDEARFPEWQRQAPFLLNRPLFKIASFEEFAAAAAAEGVPVNVVVGNSLGRQVDPTALARNDGQRWFTLAYGGARISEMLNLVDHLLNHHDVGEIVWVLPFESLVLETLNRVPGAVAALRNPFMHLFSYDTVRAVFYVARHRWLGVPYSAYNPRDIGINPRNDVTVLDELQSFWSERWLADIEARVTRAEAMGIRITFATTPKRPSLQALIEAEMADQYATFRTFVESHRLVDAVNLNQEGWTADHFIDVHHLAATEYPLFNDLILQARGNIDHIAEPPEPRADTHGTTTMLLPAGEEG